MTTRYSPTSPLTVDRFIQHFRDCTGWKCEPDTRITNELTAFAKEREGSTRHICELHVIFCMASGIKPYDKKGVGDPCSKIV